MMTKIASAAAVLLVAGSALAQGNQWNMRGTVNFADSPLITQSLGITTNTSFYNSPFGAANGAPSPAIIGVVPDAQWDSYWALGAGPNTATEENSYPYAGSALPLTVTANLAENGAGFGEPGVGAHSVLKEVNGVLGQVLFLGRLTTVGAGSYLTASDGSTVFGRVGIYDGDLGLNGLAVLTLGGGSFYGPSGLDGLGEYQHYWLVEETQEVEIGGVIHVVHDLYVTTAVPTPGAVALFGLAGMAATRRRRG
jgi:MYXO-CTERM domain-containing protein